MKNKFRIIGSLVAMCAMIVMAASCKKEYLPDEATEHIIGVERHITTSASLPQSADKAYLDETDERKVKWELTDALNINGTNLPLARMNANATSASFEGTTYAIPSGGNEIYWAVYPTTLAGAASGSTIPSNFTANQLTVTLPDTQIVNTANSALKGNTYMAAYASVAAGTQNVSFDMRNLGAVLELDLQPYCPDYTRVDSIVISSTNASLAGTFTVGSDPSNPTITPTAGSNKLVVKFQSGSNKYIDITGGKKVCVILPPLASKNLNVKIYGPDGCYNEKNSVSATLTRNRYYSSTINVMAVDDRSALVGFSVSATKRVLFSPGNLQWSATNGGTTNTTHATADGLGAEGTWRFAEHQWDWVGDAIDGTVYGVGGDPSVKCNNANIGQNYQGWIDLLGWGTSGWNSGATAYFPYSSSSNYAHYLPGGSETTNLTGIYAYADWGIYNAIYNPQTGSTDPAGTWRTITKEEWNYLLSTRKVKVGCSLKPMYGHATVNGVKGLVILPDNWNTASCPGFTYGNSNHSNIFDESTNPKWSEMEVAGCVFLPCVGRRIGTTIAETGRGYYFSSSSSLSVNKLAVFLYFYASHVYPNQSTFPAGSRGHGQAVRLVKEVH